MRWWAKATWIGWLGCGVAFLGCGQQDPDDFTEAVGASDAGTAVDSVADELYPLVAGAVWVYSHQGGDTVWEEQVELQADGDGSFLLVDSASPSGKHSESTLVEDGTRILRVNKVELSGDQIEATVDYDPGFTRFDRSWGEEAAGFEVSHEYERVEWDAAGQLLQRESRTQQYTLEAVDTTVTVPAGEFAGCVIVRRTRAKGEESTAADADDDLSKRYWFCPGVGKVREEEDGTGKLEVLLRCDIPGGSCP